MTVLEKTPPGTVRLSVVEATDIGARALRNIGFSDEDAEIILGQLIDNALCGYPFTSLSRILAIAQNPKCPSGDFMSRMNRLSGGPS